MACGAASNVVISPVNVFWRIEAQHQLTAIADVAGSLGGKYFELMTDSYVWFDTGSSVDPAPAGKSGITVVISDDDTAVAIASLMQIAIDADALYSATVTDAVVDVTAVAVGSQTDTVDVDSGVSVSICRIGKNFNVGLLEGDVETSFSPSLFTIQSHQTGVTPLGALMQGFETIEATTIMLETTRSNMKEIYSIYGGSVTPSGGTEVFGAGTGSVGKNMLIEAARLEMVPVNDLGTELSYPTNFMLAVPVPDTLTFSGENPRTLSITWSGYPDLSKNDKINAVNFGDAGQTGL